MAVPTEGLPNAIPPSTVQYHLFGNSGRAAMRLWLGVGPRSNGAASRINENLVVPVVATV